VGHCERRKRVGQTDGWNIELTRTVLCDHPIDEFRFDRVHYKIRCSRHMMAIRKNGNPRGASSDRATTTGKKSKTKGTT